MKIQSSIEQLDLKMPFIGSNSAQVQQNWTIMNTEDALTEHI